MITAGVENIMKVVHIDSLYMAAYPDAKYVTQVRLGQKAEVRLPLLGNRRLSGEVVYIDPVVEPASGGFRIKVLIPNPKHEVKAGLHGLVTLLPDAPTPKPRRSERLWPAAGCVIGLFASVTVVADG